jgi:hypothetical protein
MIRTGANLDGLQGLIDDVGLVVSSTDDEEHEITRTGCEAAV